MKKDNPYKGLFPYQAQDEKMFFGREKETSDLLEMIKNNQLVILYGESGTGKTSLIHAKLFPELKRQYYFPIYIRLNYTGKDDPLTQLRQIIYSALKKWDNLVPEFGADLTLIEYAAKTSLFNGLVKPILFFDQFEELFTIAPKHVELRLLDDLVDQISDLIEVRLPKSFRTPQPVAAGSIVDDPYDEETCTENVLRFTVVFSLRQDYIAQLDDLRFKIPSLNANRYRIKKFDHLKALDAIVKPAREFAKTAGHMEPSFIIIDESTAGGVISQLKRLELSKFEKIDSPSDKIQNVFTEKNIVTGFFVMLFNLFKRTNREKNDVSGPVSIKNDSIAKIEIDPTILSLYCYQLYEEAGLSNNGFSQITKAQVYSSPCDEIIKNYYDASLPKKKDKYAIETYLITPDGRRVLMSLKDFISKKSSMTEAAVEDLKNRTAILRIYGKDQDRALELAHDQIANRALISKKAREANVIKRNALFISFTLLIFVALVVISSSIYVREREKSVNIQYLQTVLTTANEKVTLLTEKEKELTASVKKSENTNTNLLAKQQTLISAKSETDKKLEAEVNKNIQLTIALRDSRQASSSISRLQNELSSWQARYKNQSDSLSLYKTRLARQATENKNQETALENKIKELEKLLPSYVDPKSVPKKSKQ